MVPNNRVVDPSPSLIKLEVKIYTFCDLTLRKSIRPDAENIMVVIMGKEEEEEEKNRTESDEDEDDDDDDDDEELETEPEKWRNHYSSKHRILLVGEGDFSFSLCLAREFGSAHNMVATSLDTQGTSFYYLVNY